MHPASDNRVKRMELALSIWCLLMVIHPGFSQEYVADYRVAKEDILRHIPVEYIHKARTELVIAYQHTSHGTHVSRGVFGLQDYKSGDTLLFGVSTTPDERTLEFRDYALEDYAPPGVTAVDLSVDEEAFIQTTRNYLDAPENATVNVVMWSWCDISGHNVAGNYLPGMSELISEYGPGGSRIGTGEGQRELPVSFIYMTGHANANDNTGTREPRDQSILITEHCAVNQQFCLDYYSIDTHAMDDTYYEDAGDDGDSDLYGGNFYHDWQNTHVPGADYYENKKTPGGDVAYGEHTTQHITANRKAYAFWWILARIAGWNGNFPVSDIQVSAEGDSTRVMTGSEQQFFATIFPEFATHPEVAWGVLNGTGTATLSPEGLLRGGLPGEVKVIASALEGSGVADTLVMTISDPLVPVTSISLSSAGGLLELDMGITLQCLATILPDTASNSELVWDLLNGPGMASLNADGLVTGISPGMVKVMATAQDGTGISDTLSLNILDTTVYVSEIKISSPGDVTVLGPGEELQFSADILPQDATNRLIDWSVLPGTGTATISPEGLLSALTAGSLEVRATASDGSGVFGSYALTVTGTTSLNRGNADQAMLVFPNPSRGVFYVQFGGLVPERIRVYTVLGSLVKEWIPREGEQVFELDLSEEEPGAYFLQGISGVHRSVHRILMNR